MEQGGALAGRRILVVEDDYLVAQTIAALLEDGGAEVVGPVGFVADAITFIQRNDTAFDGAVLDINLHGERSYAVADALAARAVRFVFTTGYGADAIEPPYRRYPRCAKPIDRRALFAALALEPA
jgi:CheY-like chemotaxis protein